MLFHKKQKMVGLCLVILTLCVIMSTPFQEFASFPTEIRMFEGMSSKIHLTLPATGDIFSNDEEVVHVSMVGENSSDSGQGMNVEALRSGTTELQVKVGNIPIKRVKVNVIPEIKVYPGGQSIGVKLTSEGVLVVGHHFIHTEEGKVSPGQDAKVRVGDIILKMNDIELKDLDQIGDIVVQAGESGKPIMLEVLRGKEKLKLKMEPAYDKKEEKYRIGLYIRNSAAGVGTLTFYHPDSGAYGALGHVISDVDTQNPIKVGEGSIVNSSVSSIEKGIRGGPGEKLAHFKNEDEVLGNITKNTPFGIFGYMPKRINHDITNEAIPIGLMEEVEKGPAYIYTVVEGQKVEKFDIEIVDVVDQKFPATKGLVIRVTDPVLLEKTGGIVQGMSGSPIIQNGKLVGAVTHVFVNDPTSGYGCYIEWMLQDANVPLEPAEQKEDAA